MRCDDRRRARDDDESDVERQHRTGRYGSVSTCGAPDDLVVAGRAPDDLVAARIVDGRAPDDLVLIVGAPDDLVVGAPDDLVVGRPVGDLAPDQVISRAAWPAGSAGRRGSDRRTSTPLGFDHSSRQVEERQQLRGPGPCRRGAHSVPASQKNAPPVSPSRLPSRPVTEFDERRQAFRRDLARRPDVQAAGAGAHQSRRRRSASRRPAAPSSRARSSGSACPAAAARPRR